MQMRATIKITGAKAVDAYLRSLIDQDASNVGTLAGAVDCALGAAAKEVQKDVKRRYATYADSRHKLTLAAYEHPSTGEGPRQVHKNTWNSTKPFQRSGTLQNNVFSGRWPARTLRRGRLMYRIGMTPGATYANTGGGDLWDQKRKLQLSRVATALEYGATYMVRPSKAMLAYLHRLNALTGSGTTTGTARSASNATAGKSARAPDNANQNTELKPFLVTLPARPVWRPAHKAIPGKPMAVFRRTLKLHFNRLSLLAAKSA